MLKKNIKRFISLFIIFMVPVMVFASGGLLETSSGIFTAQFIFTILISLFVIAPATFIICDTFPKCNKTVTFLSIFLLRLFTILFFDFFISTNIIFLDFFLLFIVAPSSLFVSASKEIYFKKNKQNVNINNNTNVNSNVNSNVQLSSQSSNINLGASGGELKCKHCGASLDSLNKFCPKCGQAVVNTNVVASNVEVTKEKVLLSDFDKMYELNENLLLNEFIIKELNKFGVDLKSKLVPTSVLKKKTFLNICFSVLLFIYFSLIFFHFPPLTYFIGFIILVVFFFNTRNFSLIDYLKKEVKSRPNEKISNIVMNAKNTLVKDNSFLVLVIFSLLAGVFSLIVFFEPRIIYEKTDGGYAVRYYIFGLNNMSSAVIPETYKGEKVVTLRGNTFSNMTFLMNVSLPDSVTEIRGQAFKNCKSLVEVNIPSKLEYLGGGAFYGASSIQSIELPDTLTQLGGESFKGAVSLERVKLSKNLTEIRGNTFENCSSLRNIEIPDNIVRIGGHAFYGNSSLSEVLISENSKLSEIGSSAFRLCTNLSNIKIPKNTYVNERAFKESPTVVERYGVECEYINGVEQCN